MIETITIERFKNINRIVLPLENINVLVGSNNSGKSSILQSIQFAVSIAQTTSLEEFRQSQWRENKLSTSLTTNQIIYSPIRDIYSLGLGGTLSQDKKKAIVVQFKEKASGECANFLLRKGRNKNLLTEIEGSVLGDQIRDLVHPFTIYVPGLAGIPAVEEQKSEGIIRRAAVKGDANNVFRNIILLLKQDTNNWNNFITDFNDIFPNLDLQVTFEHLKDEHINVFISNNGKNLPIDAYGTGVLQAIQILSYVHLYKPRILILDEPDSHLHPNNQRMIAEKLIEITSRLDFQIILSTHSRHLLDSFRDSALINWISNGTIKEQEYSFISVLLEIGALDKSDILNNGKLKCVVLTEDSKTEPIRVLLTANGFNIEETDLWAYEGCSKIETALVLAAFIKKSAPATKVLIHRDSDYLTSDEINEIKSKAVAAKVEIFFTLGTDIESHFINVGHIKTIYPEALEADIQVLINDSTNESFDTSIKTFINDRTRTQLRAQYNGGPRVDNGQISQDCNAEYNSDIGRYRHGKSVIKKLKNKLQENYSQRNIFIASAHLYSNELERIKNSIWTNTP